MAKNYPPCAECGCPYEIHLNEIDVDNTPIPGQKGGCSRHPQSCRGYTADGKRGISTPISNTNHIPTPSPGNLVSVMWNKHAWDIVVNGATVEAGIEDRAHAHERARTVYGMPEESEL